MQVLETGLFFFLKSRACGGARVIRFSLPGAEERTKVGRSLVVMDLLSGVAMASSQWCWWMALAAAAAATPLLVALARWRSGRRRVVDLVERIPGPRALPLVGSVFTFLALQREDIFSTIEKLSKKYWPIMRFWRGMRPDIHLSRAEDFEVVLRSTTQLQKSSTYDTIHKWIGQGLLTSSGTRWHSHRKLITPTFHFNILGTFVDVFAEKSELLVQELAKELDNVNGFNVYPYITLCTLDIICETAMGTTINAQRNKESEYVKAVGEVSELAVQRMFRPWLYPEIFFKRSSIGKKFYANLDILHNFTNKVIQERKSTLIREKQDQGNAAIEQDDIGKKRRLAFLDLLLDAAQNGAKLSDEDIGEEVDTFMFAGHDTTSSGISWALFTLGSNPDIQEKAAQEQEEIFQGSDRLPTMSDLSEMKYLERVIKETMRLYPSAPLIGRHLTEDIKIGDYVIPAGSDVTLRIYSSHHNPEHFPNPEKFDPDNFLPERVQGRHPYAYVPFSAGSRNCIGQKFALLEEKTVLSTLLRNYSFTALDKAEDLKLVSEIILRPTQGVRLRLARRKPQTPR